MPNRVALVIGFGVLIAGIAFGIYLGHSVIGSGRGHSPEEDIINAKLATLGLPTIDPFTTPTPYVNPTVTAPGIHPTPQPVDCAGASTGSLEIQTRNGDVAGGCGSFENGLFFVTFGTDTNPGGFAIFDCQPTDTSCLQGRAPTVQGAWTFFPAPFMGSFKLQSFIDPDTYLIISGGAGEFCFNFRTHIYLESVNRCGTTIRPANTPLPAANVRPTG